MLSVTMKVNFTIEENYAININYKNQVMMESILERENTQNPNFKKNALKILEENGHLFIFKRFFSNKDFYMIASEKEFDDFLNTRPSKECLTLFKNKFKIIQSGTLNNHFIKEVKNTIANNKVIDWVIIGKEEDGSQWSAYIDSEEEFDEMIEDEDNNEVIIIENQDWFNENITIHAYVPDADGIVRTGSY